MKSRNLKPSPRYANKLRVGVTLLALAFQTFGLFMGLIISLTEGPGLDPLLIAFAISTVINLVWWTPAIFLVGAYYRSLSYEIQDDEVIVRAGIITKSVKHVPYRTVTNLTVNRDPLDRWFFDLGTLKIQTAGMSGQTGAEENLVGLPNSQEVYEQVATELRRFRGAMSPTQAGVEPQEFVSSDAALADLLHEVRAIRQAVERT